MASLQLILFFTSVCLIALVASQPKNLAYRRMFHTLYRRRMLQRLFHNRGPFGNNRGPTNRDQGLPRNVHRRFHPLNRRPPQSLQKSNPLHDMDFADVLRILLMRQVMRLFGVGSNTGGFIFPAQPPNAMPGAVDPDLSDAQEAAQAYRPCPTVAGNPMFPAQPAYAMPGSLDPDLSDAQEAAQAHILCPTFSGNPMVPAQPAYTMPGSLHPGFPDAPNLHAAQGRRGSGGTIDSRRRRRPKTNGRRRPKTL